MPFATRDPSHRHFGLHPTVIMAPPKRTPTTPLAVAYPELVSRGVSKSRKFKRLVKIGASKGVTPMIETNHGRGGGGFSGQPKNHPGYATGWADQIVNDTQLSLSDTVKATQDRPTWRSIVRDATCPATQAN